MPRIRFLVVAALTAASCLSLTGVASADSVVNNRWYSWPVAPPRAAQQRLLRAGPPHVLLTSEASTPAATSSATRSSGRRP